MNATQIDQIIEQGVTDGQNAIQQGPAANLENMIHYHYMRIQSDERVEGRNYGEFLEAKARGDYDLDDFSMKTIDNHPSYVEYKLFAQ